MTLLSPLQSVTSYEDLYMYAQETIFPGHWSESRVSNLIIQPCHNLCLVYLDIAWISTKLLLKKKLFLLKIILISNLQNTPLVKPF